MRHDKLNALLLSATIAVSGTLFTGGENADAKNYKVKKGDTLSELAVKNNTTVSKIKKENNLNTNTIYINQTLKINSKVISSVASTNTTKRYINVSSLNMRTGPGNGYKVKKVLKKSTAVRIIEKNGNWLYVTTKGTKGYIYSSYVSYTKPVTTKKASTQVKKYVNISSLNMRTGAGTKYKVKKVLKKNTAVRILKTNGSWVYVTTKGTKGYVNKNYLSTKKSVVTKVSSSTKKTTSKPSFLSNGTFPMKKGTYSSYSNSWGAGRSYGGARSHEGIDIAAPSGTKIYAATAGTITANKWNNLGGWTYTIRTNGYSLYYAHMKSKGFLPVGTNVKKGQLIGYVGNTGYGPVGTKGKFGYHLHFGIYKNGKAVNPYYNLKYWE